MTAQKIIQSTFEFLIDTMKDPSASYGDRLQAASLALGTVERFYLELGSSSPESAAQDSPSSSLPGIRYEPIKWNVYADGDLVGTVEKGEGE
jgi:hypothetical protein